VTERYLERRVDRLLPELLRQHPAVSLVGPRATGKTTTARRHAHDVRRLDVPAEAAVFDADPDLALRHVDEPVLLDEWQEVPGVLGAVKRAVDDEVRPGRFILSGSVRAGLESTSWPGTGRLISVDVGGLTEAEIGGTADAATFLDRLIDDGVDALIERGSSDIQLDDYVGRALAGGFPEPRLRLDEVGRRRWARSYVDQLVTRDAGELLAGNALRDPDRLRRFLSALALNTAGLVDLRTLYEAAGIAKATAQGYERMLVNLMILDLVPAWSSNRLKRLTSSPKRYLIDGVLVAGMLDLDVRSTLADGDLLGRVLDTFVMAQLRSERAVSRHPVTLHHLRTEKGVHEIDIVVEVGARAVIGIEAKATAAPDRADGRHLEWLRDELGDRFLGGVVLHSGRHAFRLGDRVVAAPISSIWT
jgi:uncharacterized protein